MSYVIKHRYSFLLGLIILGMWQFAINKIFGFSYYPDEFGYWSSAARAVGYDWTPITSLGSYYSFGYSLVLIPVLLIFKGGVTAYRAAVTINFLLLWLSAVLIRRMAGRLYPKLDELQITIITLSGILYPTWICFSQTTMAESLLFFFYILVAYLMMNILKGEGRIRDYIGLTLSLPVMYSIHMRSVGILVAVVCVLVMEIFTRRNKCRKIIISLLAVLTLILLLSWLKNFVQQTVYTYAKEETLAINDYSGQISGLSELWSLKGMKELIRSVIGKLTYVSTVTYGLIWIVLLGICKRDGFYTYICLSIVTMLGIGSITTRGDVLGALIYGRYCEMPVPLVISLGLCELAYAGRNLKYKLLIMLCMIIPASITMWCAIRNGMTNARFHHSIGMSYFRYTSYSEYAQIGICIIAALLIYILLVVLSESRMGMRMLLVATIVMLVNIAGGYICSRQSVYRINKFNSENKYLIRDIEDAEPDKILYVTGKDDSPFVDLIQFNMPYTTIDVIVVENIENLDIRSITGTEADVIITNHTPGFIEGDSEKLKTRYSIYRENGLFEAYIR